MTRKLVVGNVPRKVNPPTTVRPPTEEGNPPSLEPGDWQTFNAGASSVDVTYPTGVAGDMILLCGYESVGGSFTTPSGFTEVFYETADGDGVALYAKISDGTESGNVSIPTGGANAVVNTNRVVANGATLSIAQIISNVATASANGPAITLLDADYMCLVGILWDGTDATLGTPPSGYELGVIGRFGSDIYGGVAQQLITGPGTEDPGVWSKTVTIITSAMAFTVGIKFDAAGASVATADHTHDHGTITGLSDDDHPQYLLGTAGGKGTINTVAASGTTETLDLGDGNDHDVTLTDNCTLTLTGATNGSSCYMTVLLTQDGTGSRTVTWPGSVEWASGSAPTLQTAAGAWDSVLLFTYDGGTTWYGHHSGSGGGVSDHGGLTGLSDDDHSQYTLADGTRAFTGVQSMGSNKLTNVTDPTSAQDAATKAYVDANSGGGDYYEVIVSGSAPPVAVTNEAEDDWIYGLVE